jgi:hypothetical protein
LTLFIVIGNKCFLLYFIFFAINRHAVYVNRLSNY